MYTLTHKTITVEGKEYTVYGIRYDESFYAEDVSADKARVEQLIKTCNSCSLDPIHLGDVIEDFLAE